MEKEIDRLGLREKPGHLLNIDETCFVLDPLRGKIVAPVGSRDIHRITTGAGRQNYTVLACVAADGCRFPPLIDFQGKHHYSSWRGENALPGTMYAVSERGWMTSTVMKEWFAKFLATVEKRPLLVILDGHVSHVSLDLISIAREQNVSLLRLPAHTSHVLQPLDVTCFGPLKGCWDKRLAQHQRQNGFKTLSKSEFVDLFCSVFAEALVEDNIRSGFRRTGIYPLDRTQYPGKLMR